MSLSKEEEFFENLRLQQEIQALSDLISNHRGQDVRQLQPSWTGNLRSKQGPIVSKSLPYSKQAVTSKSAQVKTPLLPSTKSIPLVPHPPVIISLGTKQKSKKIAPGQLNKQSTQTDAGENGGDAQRGEGMRKQFPKRGVGTEDPALKAFKKKRAMPTSFEQTGLAGAKKSGLPYTIPQSLSGISSSHEVINSSGKTVSATVTKSINPRPVVTFTNLLVPNMTPSSSSNKTTPRIAKEVNTARQVEFIGATGQQSSILRIQLEKPSNEKMAANTIKSATHTVAKNLSLRKSQVASAQHEHKHINKGVLKHASQITRKFSNKAESANCSSVKTLNAVPAQLTKPATKSHQKYAPTPKRSTSVKNVLPDSKMPLKMNEKTKALGHSTLSSNLNIGGISDMLKAVRDSVNRHSASLAVQDVKQSLEKSSKSNIGNRSLPDVSSRSFAKDTKPLLHPPPRVSRASHMPVPSRQLKVKTKTKLQYKAPAKVKVQKQPPSRVAQARSTVTKSSHHSLQTIRPSRYKLIKIRSSPRKPAGKLKWCVRTPQSAYRLRRRSSGSNQSDILPVSFLKKLERFKEASKSTSLPNRQVNRKPNRKLVMIGNMLYKSTPNKLKRHHTPDNAARSRKRCNSVVIKKISNSKKLKSIIVRGERYTMDPSGKTLKRQVIAKPSVSTAGPTKSLSRIDLGGSTYVEAKPGMLVKKTTGATVNLANRALQRSVFTAHRARFKKVNLKKSKRFCLFYLRYGKCNNGDQCRYVHDPSRVALCTRFLRGSCKGENCYFSHSISKEKMPTCLFFLRGLCFYDDCPYLHVNVGPNAPVCQNFLRGHCSSGENCRMKHTLHCPQFEKTGKCEKGNKCIMIHYKSRASAAVNELTSSKEIVKDNDRKRYYVPAENEITELPERKVRRIGERVTDDGVWPDSLPSFIALDSAQESSARRNLESLKIDTVAQTRKRLSKLPVFRSLSGSQSKDL